MIFVIGATFKMQLQKLQVYINVIHKLLEELFTTD